MKNYPAIVIAPQCPAESSWGNYDYEKMSLKKSPTKTMALLIELIEEKIATMPVDTNRIYLTGLSMGGFGSFDLLARRPELFAAAVPVCGGGDIAQAEKFAHIPMWIFHGSNDGSVDAELSRQMVEALHQAGAKPGYTQYPEVGHFSWIAAYSDPMLMAWLFRQHK
jgi:predicted peptidase